MSEQDGTQSSTKQRQSRKTSTADQQNGIQVPAPQRPANDDTEAWKAIWEIQGQPWRTEPEIDVGRQKYLAERRNIKPDIDKGIYPFRDIDPKLTRADIEWLLATHENGRGPVDWSEERQYRRNGLDLRGADLRQVDLHHLPLVRMKGGLDFEEWMRSTQEQRNMAAVCLGQALLKWVRLEGAYLRGAFLGGASLFRAHLEQAHLDGAHLQNAILSEAYLEQISLTGAILSDAKHRGPYLSDVHWNDVNLAGVKWSQIHMLGDEFQARQRMHQGRVKDKVTRLEEHEQAVRANRQLAIVLQTQGLSEDASRFAYCAQHLQCKVFWYQRKLGKYLFSFFLDLLAGYGYKPWRSFIAYLVVIAAFAISYFIIGQKVGPALSPLSAWVFSMTSFHGRGFFPGGIKLDDPLTVLAAIEAFVGLLIEVTFIATLTQRLFGK